MSKREPHIIDRRLVGFQPSVKRVQDLSYTARRFVFDDEASVFMGKFVRECGEMILHNRQFALPPCPVTYLEWNSAKFIEAIGQPNSADMNEEPPDDRVAYLISGHHVWTLSYSKEFGSGAVSLFEYDLDTPRGGQRFFGSSPLEEDWRRLALFLGSTTPNLSEEEDMSEIVNQTRVSIPGYAQIKSEYKSPEALFRQAINNSGDIRNVWLACLIINQPRHGVTSTHVPHQVGLLRGKRHVYAAHSVVSINLSEHEYRRPAHALGFATRESPRRHGVRGHFVHYRGREGCEHTWPVAPTLDEDNVPRWTCTTCGRLRVWREAFHRGDASKGFTTQEYELTT